MASNDDKLFGTETAAEMGIADQADGAAAPIKKAAAKRAPRKATKKASAPKQAPSSEDTQAPSEATSALADAAAAPADVIATPARKVAKRAPRKSVKKAAAAPFAQESAPAVPVGAAPVEVERVREQVTAAPAQNFGLLFQPPAPTETPRRRRATAPAAAPAPEPALTHEAPSPTTSEQSYQGRQDSDQGRQDSTRGSDDSDDAGSDGAPRRRRRGGKGRRGRSAGDGGGDEPTTQTGPQAGARGATEDEGGSQEAVASSQPSADDNESEGGGDSRRRTRRRRRGAAGDGDDQSGTTTRVREPRPPRDEVTSVKGSTRLEAKKMRRREGREAGRRRTVITEAEFLARRESVERVMVVRHKQDRTQIGVLEDGVLVEHYVSRETNASMAGNVYLGRIQNVLPSMEAAFVDIGKGRNAVLYAGEVNWDAAGLDNRAKRIENALSSGQSVLVQVTKDPIGHKGARLTSQVSLPGRYLVYVPDGNMMGISRKLPDTERARLKKILREVVPENAGVIVRTAAEGASEEELRADVERLTAVWKGIQAKSKGANAPSLLHGEPDLTVRVIRDVFNEDFATLVVSGEPAWEAVNGYVSTVAPDLAGRIQKWTGEEDLFTHYRVDEQIAKAMDRKVWLPSGGTLVIDRTEAMTVVDVNTGKFVGSGGNLEETVTRNNIEAAEEVVRQLRLRDIGGIIVIDFIDMVLESNRDLVVRRLLECLGRDRTKHQVAEVTSLGLVQMTRKRVGAGLIEVFSEDCEHCNGRGIIVSADPIDRPASGDGSGGGNSGGGNSGGGNSGGGGDSGSGRGTRGRRARGAGRDTSGQVATPEPVVPTGGPTPAQIAAAAHAAAVQATAPTEVAVGSTESLGSTEIVASTESVVSEEAASSNDVVASAGQEADQPQGTAAVASAPRRSRRRSSRSAESPALSTEPTVTPAPEVPVVQMTEVDQVAQVTEANQLAEVAEVPVPTKSRRRSSRSAKSPAFSVDPTAEPMIEQPVVVEPAAEPHSFTEPEQVVPAAEPTVPAATVVRARRKRPRVVAPAGPPHGANDSEAADGEFGS
ncbi:MAG: Rne/Rng family ribonuclease [Dermatophilaceae bacterium]|nr:Rne/Rng family ribonuclease [Dermatophilaceae bacterium]